MPAVYFDYSKLFDLSFLSGFSAASDERAPNGEPADAAFRRRFVHALRCLLPFSGGWILTQGVRKSDSCSKRTHESFRQLASASSTSKYYGSGAVGAMLTGQSTKTMTGPQAQFTAGISAATLFFSAHLLEHQTLLLGLLKTDFLKSYISATCKRSHPKFLASYLNLKAVR